MDTAEGLPNKPAPVSASDESEDDLDDDDIEDEDQVYDWCAMSTREALDTSAPPASSDASTPRADARLPARRKGSASKAPIPIQ
eukprot:8280565-Prorocentrum_lima.AAC.1